MYFGRPEYLPVDSEKVPRKAPRQRSDRTKIVYEVWCGVVLPILRGTLIATYTQLGSIHPAAGQA